MNAGPQHEKEDTQKIIVSLIIFAFFVFVVLPPFDYRIGLSPGPVRMRVTLCMQARCDFSSACRSHSALGSPSVCSHSSCRYSSGGFSMRNGSCAATYPATTSTRAAFAIVSCPTSGSIERNSAVNRGRAEHNIREICRE